MSITLIDHGGGNLRSIVNAFLSLGHRCVVSDGPSSLKNSERIVLPGVGAFGSTITNLREKGWIDALEEEVREKGKPFLGVCLGMQLLATTGTEDGLHSGLNWIEGTVERISDAEPGIRVPHIGWNEVKTLDKSKLHAEQGQNQDFYFMHSYVLKPKDLSVTTGICSHGEDFTASVNLNNIFGVQFHPEKSQKAGLSVLRNFLRM